MTGREASRHAATRHRDGGAAGPGTEVVTMRAARQILLQAIEGDLLLNVAMQSGRQVCFRPIRIYTLFNRAANRDMEVCLGSRVAGDGKQELAYLFLEGIDHLAFSHDAAARQNMLNRENPRRDEGGN